MYNINELATMTGLSTRTLRNYLKTGLLEGEKIDGVWQFSEEECERFFQNPTVKPAIQAKRNAIVYDFLADCKKSVNQLCLVMDLCADGEEAEEVSNVFCRQINQMQQGSGIRFAFSSENGHVRVMLTGCEDSVLDVLHAYYQ